MDGLASRVSAATRPSLVPDCAGTACVSPTDTFNVKQVRERYGVSLWVVYYWIDKGLITAQKRKLGLPYVITIPDATDHRLHEWVANSSRIAVPNPN